MSVGFRTNKTGQYKRSQQDYSMNREKCDIAGASCIVFFLIVFFFFFFKEIVGFELPHEKDLVFCCFDFKIKREPANTAGK